MWVKKRVEKKCGSEYFFFSVGINMYGFGSGFSFGFLLKIVKNMQGHVGVGRVNFMKNVFLINQ